MEPGHTRGCTEHFHVACVDVNTTDATTGATALLLLRLYRAGGLRAIGYEACRVQMYRVPVLTTVPGTPRFTGTGTVIYGTVHYVV